MLENPWEVDGNVDFRIPKGWNLQENWWNLLSFLTVSFNEFFLEISWFLVSFSVGQVIYDPLLIANLSRVSWLVETILDILDEGDSQTWRVGIEWKPTSLNHPSYSLISKILATIT